MFHRIKTLMVIVSIFLPVSVSAQVIHVPGDQPTIQEGIHAAMDHEIVLVADGTYTGFGNRDLNFNGKAIIVKSENGPGKCTIDCQGKFFDPHSAFHFQNSEGEDSVVQGFTIRNGWAAFGGGIYCEDDASPTIYGNIIIENTVSSYGGGIFCDEYSAPTIINNTISRNRTLGAMSYGGGIFCGYRSAPTIMENTIVENSAISSGGGIFCDDNSSPMIDSNIIRENISGFSGGGILCTSASPVIINNLIVLNTASYSGGGICGRYSSSPVITGTTIAGNTAYHDGGGITCERASSLTITNTILWNNNAPTGKEMFVGTSPSPSTLTIRYSDVEGGQSSIHIDPGCTLHWGSGMIDADPLFVTALRGGDYYLLQIASGQSRDAFSPRNVADSPCVDAGDREIGSLPDGIRIGTTRTDLAPDSGIIDIGFHYPERRIFIGPKRLQE